MVCSSQISTSSAQIAQGLAARGHVHLQPPHRWFAPGGASQELQRMPVIYIYIYIYDLYISVSILECIKFNFQTYSYKNCVISRCTMYIYIHIYIYIHTYISLYIYHYICIYHYSYIYISLSIYIYIYVSLYIYIYHIISIYIYMSMCVFYVYMTLQI